MSLFQRLIGAPQRAGRAPAATGLAGEQAASQPKTKGLQARDRMDARQQEDDVALWRDYAAFLTARRTLLDVRVAEAHAAFEQAEALEAQARQAQLRLDAIPASLRALFEYALEERRQQVQADLEAELRATRGSGRAGYADPDEVDRMALEELLGEAQGATTEHHLGWFPRGVVGDIRWYGLDVSELLAAPSAASYSVRAGARDDARRRIIQAVGAAVSGLLFLGFWLFIRQGAPARIAAVGAPLVNGAPVAVWAVHSALFTSAQGTTTALTLTATPAATWPQDAAARAYWRSAAIAPLVICAPSALLDDLASVRLISPERWPVRVYAIAGARTAAVDLRIESCDSAGSARPMRYGVLQQTIPPPSYALGQPVAIGNGAQTITVTAIRAIGPGQEPTLPPGQGRIVVQIAAPASLDWPAYKPTLTLASGQRLLPSATTRAADRTELSYLAPLAAGEIVLAWDLTPPEATQSLRWRATLPPPPDRATVLDQALVIAQIAIREERPGEVTVVAELANHSAEPLLLTSADVTLTQAGRSISVPNVVALADPIAAGARRTLTLTLPLGALAEPARLTIGGAPFQIAR